ncbi:DJ-1/PfpI family protein [Sphaerotilus sp.]|uniref:DJ-1/PfpI family protein n=1 Tax=Sphaerotilus sp. TaxID=2093942 RepID=UPI0034E25038
MNRRRFWHLLSFSGWSLTSVSTRAAAGEPTSPPAAPVPSKETAEAAHLEAMDRYAALLGGPKVKVAMLVYPGMFLQDLVGPLAVFESLMNKEIHLVWKNLDLVGNEKDPQPLIPVRPTTTFAQCPSDLDVLFVPGGVPGTFTLMEAPEVLRFLADKARTARFVTSVCTGSLILGAAGLLKGYRATSHWSTVDVLKDLGAIPVRERVVIDRNRITGGGVTAGIDFGLTIAALVTSKDYAQAIQLYLEYDPAPPFNAGSPDKAPPLARQFLVDMFAGMVDHARHTAQRAMQRLGG